MRAIHSVDLQDIQRGKTISLTKLFVRIRFWGDAKSTKIRTRSPIKKIYESYEYRIENFPK